MRRRWFPKIKVTILEPVKLKVDPALKGRKRRLAAGAAMYEIMSNLMFRTTSTDRTVVEAVIEAARDPRHGRIAVRIRSPARSPTSGCSAPQFSAEADGAGAGGQAGRRHAAELERCRCLVLALMSAGRVPAMINFTAGAANVLAACRAAQVEPSSPRMPSSKRAGWKN